MLRKRVQGEDGGNEGPAHKGIESSQQETTKESALQYKDAESKSPEDLNNFCRTWSWHQGKRNASTKTNKSDPREAAGHIKQRAKKAPGSLWLQWRLLD